MYVLLAVLALDWMVGFRDLTSKDDLTRHTLHKLLECIGPLGA